MPERKTVCPFCDGTGWVPELPGMGGSAENSNFSENYQGWKRYHASAPCVMPRIRLAPMTGAKQNVGYYAERQFYFDLLKAAITAHIGLSIGDGTPDEKLQFGIEALQSFNKKGAVFIKPYMNDKILERMEWAGDVAEIIGIDIDSYNIVTMRNIAKLEKKTAAQLSELKSKSSVPFAIKGVFLPEELELVRAVKPDIVIVSNHGGRISTRRGCTADYLAEYGKELARYAGEVWVDGGLRSRSDLCAAQALGAPEVMIGRACIYALLKDKEQGIKHWIDHITAEDS